MKHTGTSKNVVLVVSGDEFVINRQCLVENNDYFRAMFDGNFLEADMDRIEFNTINNSKAFAVVVHFIIHKEVDLLKVSGITQDVLELADMLGEEIFSVLQENLLHKWTKLGTLSEVLEMGECLRVKSEILKTVQDTIGQKFAALGHELFKISDGGRDVKDVVVMAALETKEITIMNLTKYSALDIAKGLIHWSLDQVRDKINFEHVARNLREAFITEKKLWDLISKHEEGDYKRTLEKHLKLELTKMRKNMSMSLKQIGISRFSSMSATYVLNFDTWKWEMIQSIDNLRKKDGDIPLDVRKDLCFSTEQNGEMFVYRPSEKENSGSLNIEVLISRVRKLTIQPQTIHHSFYHRHFRNNVLQRIDVLCATFENMHPRKYEQSRLLVKKLVGNGPDAHFTLFREAEIKGYLTGSVTNCQLVKIDQVVHGFVSHILRSKSSALSHFHFMCTDEYSEDNPSIPQLELHPIKIGRIGSLVPVAGTSSSGEIYVLFLYNRRCLWLAKFSPRNYTFRTAGFLPPIPVSEFEHLDNLKFFFLKDFSSMNSSNLH